MSISLFFKDITPRKLSFTVALLVTFCVIFTLALISTFSPSSSVPLRYLGLIALVVSLSSYLIVLQSIRYFIFRKIKLIYKSIRKSRVASKEKKRPNSLSENVLSEVEREVDAWQKDQIREMESIRLLEEYRRNYVGNVAHELKTPVFNIQGYLHTLLDGAIDDENVRMSFLEKACRNLERLGTILDDLDEINKIESGKIVLDLRKFEIKELTLEIFAELEMVANHKNINLELKEGASKPYMVVADRDKIRQVLTNLITNSVKYGREDGRTLISFYDMDKYILVEVSDNGIGINTTHLKHLFDRFYRVDKGRSRSAGGSGLGLSIVKHILEAHNETITVRSAPDVGTTFGFTLRKHTGSDGSA